MKNLFLIQFILFLVFSARAQFPVINAVDFIPDPPVSNAPFEVAVSVTLPNSGKLVNRNWILDASSKLLMLEYCYGDGLLTVVTTIQDTLQLPATAYTGTLQLKVSAFIADTLCQVKKSESIFQDVITISSQTGIANVRGKAKELPFYDAASGQLLLRGLRYDQLLLTDLFGREIMRWEEQDQEALPLTAVAEGCYILHCSTAGDVQHVKFIRNRP